MLRCHALERVVTCDMCVTEASLAGLLAALQATHSRVEAECGELQGDLARLGQVSSDWSVVGHVTSILTSDWPGDPAPAAAGRRGSDEGCRHSGREVGMDGYWPERPLANVQEQLATEAAGLAEEKFPRRSPGGRSLQDVARRSSVLGASSHVTRDTPTSSSAKPPYCFSSNVKTENPEQ